LLAEADGNNNITRYYIHGLGLLAMVTSSDQLYVYHFNAVGSTVAITDSGQNIVNKYAYTPFGIIANQQETINQPFKFVGQHGVMTEPNGFYYMRARYYDPEVGRFISEDPLGFDGGDVNLYVYVGNNPVLLIDPYGMIQWGKVGGGAILIGHGLYHVGVGVALGYISLEEATTVVGSVMTTHTLGLAGTFISVGGAEMYLGWELIREGVTEEQQIETITTTPSPPGK